MKTSRITGIVAAIAVLAVVAVAAASGSTTRATTVKTGHALGKTVLVNSTGRTLYSLSAETHGRFICTGACLSLWHPLTVHAGQKPSGAKSLSTIRRPNGGPTQVTYKGKPLYTFSGDKKRGDANGEGLKDVGTWHAATVGAAAKQPSSSMPTQTGPSYPSYPNGY